MLSGRRRQLLLQPWDLGRLRGTTDDAVTTLLTTAAELHLRADLAFTDAAEEQAERGRLTSARREHAAHPDPGPSSTRLSHGP